MAKAKISARSQLSGVIDGKTQSTESHDGSIVEESNHQNHEGWEVGFVGKGKDSKTDDNTDGNSAGVDQIVPHMLEDDMGTMNGMNPGLVRTMSAAPQAALAAPSTVIPMFV